MKTKYQQFLDKAKEFRRKVRELHAQGETQSEIARKLLVSRARINQILNGRPRIGAIDRRAIYDRQGGKCYYCGAEMATGRDDFNRDRKRFTIDHKIPRTLDGATDLENCVGACRSCNARKHTKTALEFTGHPESDPAPVTAPADSPAPPAEQSSEVLQTIAKQSRVPRYPPDAPDA